MADLAPAPKRRKLSNEHDAPESPVVRLVKVAPVVTIPSGFGTGQAATPSNAAQQAWLAAKSKSKGYAKRINPTAAASLVTGKERLPPGANITVATAPSPRKQFDPLRHQQQSSNGVSPRDSNTIEVKSFFKQFHAPVQGNGAASLGEGDVIQVRPRGSGKTPVPKARKNAGIKITKTLADEDGGEDELGGPDISASQASPQQMRVVLPQSESHLLTPTKASKKQLDRRKSFKADAEMMDVDGRGTTTRIPISLPKPKPIAARLWPVSTFEERHVEVIQQILMERLARKRPMRLVGMKDEYTKVSRLIKQTVTAGESNSMLLIGSRGSGKTAMIDRAIREQNAEHAGDFHVVRLNGFIHTDDRIALREIWRQLGREMEIDEDEGTAKNYADTLTTLLALLSHPTDMGMVAQAGYITKSVIFVIDEFDLFAGHPRQTLLYNLFDIAQSRKAPIAVLGLTTRIDAVEGLEKRVKSRFSHRYVHLGLAKSFGAFEDMCQQALSIFADELDADESIQLRTTAEEAESSLEAALDSAKASSSIIEAWNSVAEQMIASTPIAHYLRRLYYTTKSLPSFLSSMLPVITTLPLSTPEITSTEILAHITTSFEVQSLEPVDSKLSLLPSLSTLQLALLICAARLNAIYSTEVISFTLAYEEYKGIASKARLQASAAGAIAQGAGARIWSKDVARGAWEMLFKCGLLLEDGRNVGGSGRVDVGLEEIGASRVDLGSWARWCKEI
jgi:origin recognition complex subunit 4